MTYHAENDILVADQIIARRGFLETDSRLKVGGVASLKWNKTVAG
jgi:hypothetical protein